LKICNNTICEDYLTEYGDDMVVCPACYNALSDKAEPAEVGKANYYKVSKSLVWVVLAVVAAGVFFALGRAFGGGVRASATEPANTREYTMTTVDENATITANVFDADEALSRNEATAISIASLISEASSRSEATSVADAVLSRQAAAMSEAASVAEAALSREAATSREAAAISSALAELSRQQAQTTKTTATTLLPSTKPPKPSTAPTSAGPQTPVIMVTAMTMKVGSTGTIPVQNPDNVKIYFEIVMGSPQNKGVIELNNQTGEVTALKAGAAMVNVYLYNGWLIGKCTITVTQ